MHTAIFSTFHIPTTKSIMYHEKNWKS